MLNFSELKKKNDYLLLLFHTVLKFPMRKYTFYVTPLHFGVQFREEFHPFLKELIDCIINTYILEMVQICLPCCNKIAIYRGNNMELK